ncbi:MAG: tyrosine-type recombinase/integrase [Spirochaetota bacterium]
MKNPYLLRKRNGIYQYKLAHEKTYHSTQQRNKKKAIEFVIFQMTGEVPEKSLGNMTLGAFTTDFFLPKKCRFISKKNSKGKEITKEMAQMRRGHLINHILPAFGQRLLETISKSEVDEWLIGYQKVSNRTKNYILDTIKIIWDEAVDRGVVKENSMRTIEKFNNNYKSRDILTMNEMKKLFPQQVDELVTIWGSIKLATLFYVLATTGMREGEALALSWSDWMVTGADSVLHINKSVKNDRRIGSTKNKKERISFVNRYTAILLEEWKDKTEYCKNDDLIFPNLIGEPLQRKVCQRTFQRGLRNAQVHIGERNIVVHSLRHGFNTLYRPILGDEALQTFTGHSSKEMTSHYDHPSMADRISILSKYAEVFNQTWDETVLQKAVNE